MQGVNFSAPLSWQFALVLVVWLGKRLDRFFTRILTRSKPHNEKGLAVVRLPLSSDRLFGMPRHRIELWTRGFSVRCSTD
jgi:hypothetical protein